MLGSESLVQSRIHLLNLSSLTCRWLLVPIIRETRFANAGRQLAARPRCTERPRVGETEEALAASGGPLGNRGRGRQSVCTPSLRRIGGWLALKLRDAAPLLAIRSVRPARSWWTAEKGGVILRTQLECGYVYIR